MESARSSRIVASCLFALVLVALVKCVLTDPGKKMIFGPIASQIADIYTEDEHMQVRVFIVFIVFYLYNYFIFVVH